MQNLVYSPRNKLRCCRKCLVIFLALLKHHNPPSNHPLAFLHTKVHHPCSYHPNKWTKVFKTMDSWFGCLRSYDRDIKVFKNYYLCTIHSINGIVDGSLSPVARTRSIELTKDLHLYFVLYVPKLNYNLLSISKLIHDLKCVTKFYWNICVF